MTLQERLRGYNPPDRTIDSQRQIAVDIHEAADALDAKDARIKRLEDALRELLADTQHAEHAQDGKCDDFCPVLRARAALDG